MNDVLAAAVEVQDFLRVNSWSFCVIGGVALARWGLPRTTVDVDLVLLTGFGTEEPFVDALLAKFKPRRDKAKEFAIINRVLLMEASNGVGIDVALAALPFEENATRRATEFDYGEGASLLTASAEDMIVLKAFAGRPQDWIDVKGIIIRQGDKLDWDQIVDELTPLCELKESPESVNHLIQLRDQLSAE